MKDVVVVQALAKQYRVPFFENLCTSLAGEGVRLRVVYGDPPPAEQRKADDVPLDPRYGVRVPGRWMLGDRFLYQPVLPLARQADLVIVEQANKHLVNVPLLVRSRMGRGKVAFWGVGRNVHVDGRSLGERVKARTAALVDWWFAYTKGVADYVTSRGMRSDTVTVVQNAIDTRAFRAELDAVTKPELDRIRADLGIAVGDPVGLFCGSLYAGKKVEFLIDAARRIRAALPRFHLVVVGAGPIEQELRSLAAGADWIHFVGRQGGAARAVYFRAASVFLMPAFVGLAIVDAFAAGLPVVTTHLPNGHGVEVEYIEHGRNGVVTEHDVGAYAQAVVSLLRDDERRRALAAGARVAGDFYTIETMVDNFTEGVLRCLRAGR